MKKAFFVLVITTLFSPVCYSQNTSIKLQPGDILFQDLDCGDACDAIEKVTQGARGMDFSHCGIVIATPTGYKVVEAYGSVKATPVDSFLKRSTDKNGQPKVLLGRVKEGDKALAQKSAALATQYLGKGYDDVFDMKNESYYCSELVYEVYKEANDGTPYFKLNKMTFKEPGSDNIMPFWTKYFAELYAPVPEGEWGINPGAISRSNKLNILPVRLK
jgi:hypothetical protein